MLKGVRAGLVYVFVLLTRVEGVKGEGGWWWRGEVAAIPKDVPSKLSLAAGVLVLTPFGPDLQNLLAGLAVPDANVATVLTEVLPSLAGPYGKYVL